MYFNNGKMTTPAGHATDIADNRTALAAGSLLAEMGQEIRISVELPLAPSPVAGVRALLAPLQEGAPQPFAGRRMLVADDSLINQQVAVHMLEKLGCSVDVAGDGREAVDLHRASGYDLVLMDCEMPQLDGYQAAAEIRALEGALRRTPIVALTAYTTQSERDKCLVSGMNGFLSKPIRPQLLKEALARWLVPVAEAVPESAAVVGDELEAVHEMFGPDFPELVALYRNGSPPRIAALQKAHATGDNAQVAKVAHAFSGSSASIGATGLSALCKELEMCAKGCTLDDFENRLAAIKAEYRRVCNKLHSMLT